VVGRNALAVREKCVKATDASGPASVYMCFRSVLYRCVHFPVRMREEFFGEGCWMLSVTVLYLGDLPV
jgi:hypothetical protein